MDLIRIGEKVISKSKIDYYVAEILRLRTLGLSQTEVAGRMGIDRTFVSRLENIGEVRKGKSLAVVGFPIANKEQLETMLQKEGVDFILLMSEVQRWDFIRQKSGIELFNATMELMAKAHIYDQIIVIGSNQRIKLLRAALDKEVVGLEIGASPLKEDKYVDPAELLALVRAIKAKK